MRYHNEAFYVEWRKRYRKAVDNLLKNGEISKYHADKLLEGLKDGT